MTTFVNSQMLSVTCNLVTRGVPTARSIAAEKLRFVDNREANERSKFCIPPYFNTSRYV